MKKCFMTDWIYDLRYFMRKLNVKLVYYIWNKIFPKKIVFRINRDKYLNESIWTNRHILINGKMIQLVIWIND